MKLVHKINGLLCVLLCAIVLAGVPHVINAEENLPSSENFIRIARESLPAVVSIRVTKKTEQIVLKQPEDLKDKNGNGKSPYELFEKYFQEEIPDLFEEKEMEIPAAGSGLILSPDGYLLTNNHVIAGAKDNTIEIKLNDGTRFKGEQVKIVGKDPLTDLAVLKIDGDGFKTIPWGETESLQIGEWVLAVGNPFDLSGSVTQGIVSAKHRIINKVVLEDLIQTTAVINPGSSGGPLINLDGEVVGINTAIATRSGIWQGVGFAIPSKVARRVAEEIMQYGEVRQGWIGIFMRKISSEIASFYGRESNDGVFIMDVVPGSPAEDAGIHRYDLIVEMNGEKIESPLDLLQSTASKSEGEEVTLTIIRLVDDDKKELSLTLRLGNRPDQEALAKIQPKTTLSKTYDSIGLRVTDIKEEGINGVEITDVKRGSHAHKAQLARGDVILEINKHTVTGLEDYRTSIKSPQNKRLLIRYLRNGTEEIAVVKIK